MIESGPSESEWCSVAQWSVLRRAFGRRIGPARRAASPAPIHVYIHLHLVENKLELIRMISKSFHGCPRAPPAMLFPFEY